MKQINSQYFFPEKLMRDSMYYPAIEEHIEFDTLTNQVVYINYSVLEYLEYNKGGHTLLNIGFSFTSYQKSHKTIFYNSVNDTCILRGVAVVFYNPYPHVFKSYNTSTKIDSANYLFPFSGNYRDNFTSSTYPNGNMRELCLYNDSLGTYKCYWYNNTKIKKNGHYWQNRKNGKWEYWKETGELCRVEIWDKGVLKRIKEYD